MHHVGTHPRNLEDMGVVRMKNCEQCRELQAELDRLKTDPLMGMSIEQAREVVDRWQLMARTDETIRKVTGGDDENVQQMPNE